jgi:lipopolysaccharide transport system ATP-binding protein
MTEPAIRVESLSKLYRIGLAQRHHDTLRDLLVDTARNIGRRFTTAPRSTEDELWALKDVSFAVQPGEVVGIIGRNGAGKSTLLKILSRITEPTSGRAVLNGRVGSLLEVGTGFHPELTGRENIYLNGAILGMHRYEIARKFDEIVAFSEIERFLDTPVKRYSSGMYVRLAFAVAAHLEPEILIVDEVLAVGDAEFQKKCLGKMGAVADEGRTVLFVSHNMAAVQNLCHHAILLDNGIITEQGLALEVVNKYLSTSYKMSLQYDLQNSYRKGNGDLRFTKTWIEDDTGNRVNTITVGRPFIIIAEYQKDYNSVIKDPYITFTLRDSLGNYLTDLWNQGAGYSWDKVPVRGQFICEIPKCNLNQGVYFYTLYCRYNQSVSDHVFDAGKFTVEFGDFFGTQILPSTKHSPILIEQKWRIQKLE